MCEIIEDSFCKICVYLKINIRLRFVARVVSLAGKMNDCIHIGQCAIIHIFPRICFYNALFFRRDNVKAIDLMVILEVSDKIASYKSM